MWCAWMAVMDANGRDQSSKAIARESVEDGRDGAFRTIDGSDPQWMRWLVSERASDERPESGSIEQCTAKHNQAKQGNPAAITRTATGASLAFCPPAQRRFVAPKCIVEGSALLLSRRASFPARRPLEKRLAGWHDASSRQHPDSLAQPWTSPQHQGRRRAAPTRATRWMSSTDALAAP